MSPATFAHNVSEKLVNFIKAVPKAELHLHIEGTLQPELMLKLAERNGIPAPYPTVEAAEAAYNFEDLQSFLDLYYYGCGVLVHQQDFYDLTWAYLTKCQEEGVTHTEIMFDPQTHLANNVEFSTVVNGLLDACKDAKTQYGIHAQLIMSFLRHLSEEEALEVLDMALPYKEHFAAVGLDSSELGNPPAKFQKVMQKAREAGLRTVAHAGEEGPAQFVWDSLNLLKVSRVDHGVRSVEDPKLMALLAEQQVPLTVCPLSNLKLKVYDGELKQRMHELIVDTGLCITLNSDDPAYFGGYLVDNYVWIAEVCDLSLVQVAELVRNSFRGSFISEEDKAASIAKINALVKEFEMV